MSSCRYTITTALILASIWLSAPALECRGQSLRDLVKTIGIEGLVRDYLRPGADAVGYGINSGLYHTARVNPGFSVWAGVKAMWTVIPSDDHFFRARLPESLTRLGYSSEVVTSSVVGPKGTILRSTSRDSSGNPYPDIPLPGGTRLAQTVLFVPHVTIGSYAATQVMLRGIPPVTFDPEIGKVQFFGIGLQHGFSQWLRLPVDVAGMVGWQVLEIGNTLQVQCLFGSLHASIPLSFLTPFCGVGYESYDITASYQYTPPVSNLPGDLDDPHRLEMDFKRRNLRLTLGLTASVFIFDVTGSYSFGIQDTYTLGAGIKF